ncbi:MAG: hypothetical protein IJ790_00845 [Lachnospiraceae bacterium]|nr:hypothetical protein [Lachnospiraceae bacterium]
MQLDLNKKAQEIIEKAQKMGQEQNFLFMSQFKQYVVLINTLGKLEKQMNDSDLLITKEYVKGRQNLCANPVIGEYVRVSNACNSTAIALVKIITGLSKDKLKEKEDDKNENALLNILNG